MFVKQRNDILVRQMHVFSKRFQEEDWFVLNWSKCLQPVSLRCNVSPLKNTGFNKLLIYQHTMHTRTVSKTLHIQIDAREEHILGIGEIKLLSKGTRSNVVVVGNILKVKTFDEYV